MVETHKPPKLKIITEISLGPLVPVRHQLGGDGRRVPTGPRAIPFNALKLFDRRRSADLIAARCCAAAHFAPLHRINHRSRKSCEIELCHLLLTSAQPTG
jgi:hypothetical protein